MTDIILVRQTETEIPESERAIARKVLFGAIDGLGEVGKKSWRRFVNGLFKLQPGEMVEIKTHRDRSGPFHRRHFALESALFESQERFEHRDQMFYWLKVGAGWVTWCAGPKGGVVPIPRSVSYAKADEDEFRDFHDRVVTFLRGPHAARYLWPHLDEGKAAEMMDGVLLEFEE
jgi:hypothetical protein